MMSKPLPSLGSASTTNSNGPTGLLWGPNGLMHVAFLEPYLAVTLCCAGCCHQYFGIFNFYTCLCCHYIRCVLPDTEGLFFGGILAFWIRGVILNDPFPVCFPLFTWNPSMHAFPVCPLVLLCKIVSTVERTQYGWLLSFCWAAIVSLWYYT